MERPRRVGLCRHWFSQTFFSCPDFFHISFGESTVLRLPCRKHVIEIEAFHYCAWMTLVELNVVLPPCSLANVSSFGDGDQLRKEINRKVEGTFRIQVLMEMGAEGELDATRTNADRIL